MLWRYRLRCSSVLGRGMHAGGRPEHRVDHGAHRGTLAVATESAYPNPRGLRPRVPRTRGGSAPASPRTRGGPAPASPRQGSAAEKPPPDSPAGRSLASYERPPNSVVTDPSSNTSRIARAINGAIDRTVSLSRCVPSGRGSVLVTTTSLILLLRSRSVAGSESTGWVAATITSAAPSSNRTCAAPVMVLAVSIMSSTTKHTRPSTSPTTRLATTSLGFNGSRVLWMNASGQPPSRSVQRSATRTRPESGATTVIGRPAYLLSTYSARTFIAKRWSTGPSKKPWICAVCRSTVRIRSAPAVLSRSAISRAVIGSRPRCFLSCRPYG